MVDISSQNNKINITVSSSGNTANTNITPDYAQYYSEKSKEWAISNKIVDNTDYSSKYYANESKKQADISTAKATEVVESSNNAVTNIESARDNAINDVNTAGATQIALATEQATIATNKASEVVASGNEALANIDTAKNNAITSITNQETTSKTSLIDEGATQIGLIQNEGATQVANVQSTGFYMRDDKLYYINSQGEETEFKSGGSGLELCDIGMALYIDESKGLRRYLNGQIVDINANTQAFLNRLKQITTLHPSLLCTEDEWQTAKTMSAFGQVGKFVFNYSGDEVVSVRLPRVVNVQGLFDLQNLGMTVGAGLPNIEGGVISSSSYIFLRDGASGAFKIAGRNGIGPSPSGYDDGNSMIIFDASLSNSIYGKSTTVQPEAIQYPYFIQIATGSETENNIINDIELNNPYSLFDSKYSDHELNNLSWLKSEGQWNAKAVYPDAYDELLREYNSPDRLATFNKDAFEVVGNPTITDDGVASGFSSSNYLRLPYLFDAGNKDFELTFKVNKTSTGVGSIWSYRNVSSDYVLGLLLGNDNKIHWRIDYDSSTQTAIREIVSNTILQLNTYYYIKIGVKNKKGYIKLSTDGRNYILEKETTDEISSFKTYYDNRIGVNTGETIGEFFNGSIDLKHFSITVDGVKVFSGAKSKVKLSTEEYTDYDFVLNTAEETFRLPLLDGSEDLPSEKYEDLTLLASGSTYTAPANGQIIIFGESNTEQNVNHVLIATVNTNKSYGNSVYGATMCLSTHFSVRKGDIFKLVYARYVNKVFRFIYAQGNGSLYYYVGETVQNANLIDAGRIGEQLANKQDKCIHIIDTYVNGTSGYRIWSDGYCEQWGESTFNSGGSTVSLLKTMKSTEYIITYMFVSTGTTNYGEGINVSARTVSSFTAHGYHSTALTDVLCKWLVKGYLASGQY